ncbi:ErfK/YbiS/YcfS/YnhG family protein [Fibrella aestuarina BUZ 2]|uniref:ErfK/YbiS/YcfS/YnhG family protein n=1 Tax=Fibrella aestuarina BUZ 2 TaxID=1166018 RepID=I0KCC9_9BACT|nr:L,D-transpeptidase family protein [Fibrella aestuarina]CCH01782.1 ErfK/YbiS/YcfS/YnhG family protein [Fibrella aestuarina BUZ 2]
MRRSLAVFLLLLTVFPAVAQTPGDWVRLRQYAHSIGVDSLCAQPDAACLTRYFTQLVYGRTPRRMGYQGVAEQLDTVRLHRLTRLFLAGGDWCPLLDSLEPHDRRYRQLTAYCLRCLIDDYLGDSLTIGQVHETLNTYRWLNRFPVAQRVVVNIPSATLRLIDGRGDTQFSSRVVVGKPSTPTPVFAAYIPSLVMYPYWTIPRSILAEYLPKIRKNPTAALNQFGLQVLDNKGQLLDPSRVDWTVSASAFPYRLRQSTGCDNALGLLKFSINSPYDVYLHDTNVRRAFSLENRFLSHGCIRVERPADLANRLLGRAQFSADYLTRCPINASPKTIVLPRPIPVITTYNVLDLDDDGAIRVYPDRYGWWRLVL